MPFACASSMSGTNGAVSIAFSSSDGVEYRFDSDYGHPGTVQGQAVTVLHPQTDLSRARLESDDEHRAANWLWGALLAFVVTTFVTVDTRLARRDAP